MAVPPLEPPDTHHVSAALGWLGLGNPAEAELELTQISAGCKRHPDVLEVRWLICVEQEKWAEGLQVARGLIHAAPERASGWLHQAYALRRAPGGGLKQAWDALLDSAGNFPKEPLFAYNLACYACQMGNLAAARDWLGRAISAGEKPVIKDMALSDSDLEPLWKEIRSY